jgi:hypothetical protein
MTELSPEQADAIQIAHDLVDMGVPIFTAFPNTLTGDFLYPDGWQHKKPSHQAVERWAPGMAMCMVTGVVFDVLDVDPRNGGDEGVAELYNFAAVPRAYGRAYTPSHGQHHLIRRTGLRKGRPAKGVDLQAGDRQGEGRGFVFIAPTVRVAKYGPHTGQPVPYRWVDTPDPAILVHDRDGLVDEGLDNLVALLETARAPRRTATVSRPAATEPDPDIDAFADMVDGSWTADEATRVIDGQLQAVRDAREGSINDALGGAARVLGRFVAGGFLTEDVATMALLEALELGRVHSDTWNVANGKSWTAATVIGAGLANGAREPWTVEAPVAGAAGATPATGSGPITGTDDGQPSAKTGDPVRPVTGVSPTATVGQSPPLCITSAAEMAYWLQNALGSANLSGYFLRGGQVVHTPRVDEMGYVAPRGDEDENGPAQIQAVSAAQLTAKIQYAFRCYKVIKDKESGEQREVPALFPLEAAKRAVDAPEAMAMLRGLAGITHTPMVRPDGSVLERPGYDPATRFLFLPGPGVRVARVPEDPSREDLVNAMALLDEMLAGFPWESKDDYANYLGLLLTPMLRLVTPPSYKMFGIGAHQPGSGKTLLADIATILHGGVLRSEMPEDESEMRKQTTSILATTSAPIVHIDNVTGVLRSSTLAGLLTAGQPLQDRELGSSRMITTINDRVWVVTGNNLSLGGDLVRRTIIITIDPNMANPETRQFRINDLKGWVAAHRNELLWALLVMIRTWVAAGRPMAQRAQSDSFATWESSLAGILNVCGVPGEFDAQSGKRAAAGGDDDGLAGVLEHVWALVENQDWSVAEILSDTMHTPLGDFVNESRDWLPSVVLDKLARSEPNGRKTFGKWLRFRLGRWVTGSDGHSYVIREAPKDRLGARWRIERTA